MAGKNGHELLPGGYISILSIFTPFKIVKFPAAARINAHYAQNVANTISPSRLFEEMSKPASQTVLSTLWPGQGKRAKARRTNA
jgi:hypothetical protein